MTVQISRLAKALEAGAPVSAINYHNTPAYRRGQFDRDLDAIAQCFAPTTEADLAKFLATGAWPHSKPGVVIALYNGSRNNYDVFRPLLEKHGLVGWFFAASGYVSCRPEDQAAFAAVQNLKTIPGEYPDGRYAMSWDELRDLDGRHVIASHTRNHTRVSLADQSALEDEIIGSQDDFRANLGHAVRSFAWLLGGAYGESPLADRCVDRAGYEFLFSNFKIQKLPNPS